MQRTLIIAEAGVNHNGSLELAKQLVDKASEAGADIVKFQTFRAEALVSRFAPKADYQKKTTSHSESQLDMIRKLQLDDAAHKELQQYCALKKIGFLSTPFDQRSLRFLIDEMKLPILKISSGDLTTAPLLLEAARSGLSVILSTGMSTLGEIEEALGVLAFGYLAGRNEKAGRAAFEKYYSNPQAKEVLQKRVSILHCTTEYPAPFDQVNLKAMKTISLAFGLPVGFSDHTEGIAVPIAAVARGATIIEKHFTLDRTMPGPDHKASLNPAELKAMVQGIRQVEMALGVVQKVPQLSEVKNREAARKSIVASRNILKGEVFSSENVTLKRPGTGISPINYWNYLGQSASRDFQEDECIE